MLRSNLYKILQLEHHIKIKCLCLQSGVKSMRISTNTFIMIYRKIKRPLISDVFLHFYTETTSRFFYNFLYKILRSFFK